WEGAGAGGSRTPTLVSREADARGPPSDVTATPHPRTSAPAHAHPPLVWSVRAAPAGFSRTPARPPTPTPHRPPPHTAPPAAPTRRDPPVSPGPPPAARPFPPAPPPLAEPSLWELQAATQRTAPANKIFAPVFVIRASTIERAAAILDRRPAPPRASAHMC